MLETFFLRRRHMHVPGQLPRPNIFLEELPLGCPLRRSFWTKRQCRGRAWRSNAYFRTQNTTAPRFMLETFFLELRHMRVRRFFTFSSHLGPKSDPNVVYLRARNLAGRPEGQDDVYLRAGLRPASGRPGAGRIFHFYFNDNMRACLPPARGGASPVVNIYD